MADSIFISLPAIGGRAQLKDEVFISFYGPRGGSRATEIITIETAAKLRDELVEKLGGGLFGDMLAALHLAAADLEAQAFSAALVSVREAIAKAEGKANG